MSSTARPRSAPSPSATSAEVGLAHPGTVGPPGRRRATVRVARPEAGNEGPGRDHRARSTRGSPIFPDFQRITAQDEEAPARIEHDRLPERGRCRVLRCGRLSPSLRTARRDMVIVGGNQPSYPRRDRRAVPDRACLAVKDCAGHRHSPMPNTGEALLGLGRAARTAPPPIPPRSGTSLRPHFNRLQAAAPHRAAPLPAAERIFRQRSSSTLLARTFTGRAAGRAI